MSLLRNKKTQKIYHYIFTAEPATEKGEAVVILSEKGVFDKYKAMAKDSLYEEFEVIEW